MLCRQLADGKGFAVRVSYLCRQLWLTAKLLFPVVMVDGVTNTEGALVIGAALVPEWLPTMLGIGHGPCRPPAFQFPSDSIKVGMREVIVFATSSWTSCGSMFTFSSGPRT